MRVQAFITSGVLEKYVLGMATEEEKADVLEMASQHLEIKEELAAIRKTMRGYIVAHRVAPPADLYAKVAAITNKPPNTVSRNDQPRSVSPSYSTPKREQARSGGSALMPIGLGLLSIALIAACLTAYTFFNDVENAKNEAVEAQEVVEDLKKQLATEQAKTKEVQAKLDFYLDPDNRMFILQGTSQTPNAKAVIYWNDKSRSAASERIRLPQLAEGKVAVLWANIGRTPQNLGILTANDTAERISLTYVENPNLFFVTEENTATAERPNRFKVLMSGG